MYSELTPRVLVGGFVSAKVDANYLVHTGVTHLVNASDVPLPVLVTGQFWTLEVSGATRDADNQQWPELFSFVRRALNKRENKVCFHVTSEVPERPVAPVAVYAALRALGFTAIRSRLRLLALHPVLTWHERAMQAVDARFGAWKRLHPMPAKLRTECSATIALSDEEQATVTTKKADPTESEVLAWLREGAAQWKQ
jgi:hypothetical protein